MTKGFIMMTALPPTKGHVSLINWAAHYCRSYGIESLHVMVCSQPEEPYLNRWRDLSIDVREAMSLMYGGLWVHSFHKAMPQNPDEHEEFWGLWQSQIYDMVGTFADDDIVFSSEPYGKALAKVLGCTHIPYDLERGVTKGRASLVRHNPYMWYPLLAPTTARRFQKTVTFFGAESTGKTTLAKYAAATLNSQYLPEWARGYLESLDTPEVTMERMENIVHGQRALESTAKSLTPAPFIVRDTDLLSTLGYYRIFTEKPPRVAINKADLYIVCPSNIPFTPDPLRYGGDKRESSDQFWIDLLKEYDCNYVVLQSDDLDHRKTEAIFHMDALFKQEYLWGYERKGNN